MKSNNTNINLFASIIAPDPKLNVYWVDITADPYGKIIKYFDDIEDDWKLLNQADITDTITIGDNGNWFINGIDTGISSKGSIGATGPKGDPGDRGFRGIQGVTGKQGKDGINGIDGIDGSPGVKGDPGIQGTQGIPGRIGDTGNNGYDGLDGLDGIDGSKGDKGESGNQGSTGSDGLDGLDGIDGKDIEFIFKVQKVITTPPTPISMQSDDYVPEGWTDDQQGVNSEFIYEFVSLRRRVNNIWSNFTEPTVWAKYSFDGSNGTDGSDGIDGLDGKDGKDIEFIFRRQVDATIPPTPPSEQIDEFIPIGWTDDQSGVTQGFPYELVSIRRKNINGIWGEFNTPAVWSKFGADGAPGEDGIPGIDGIDGKDIEFIFRRSTSGTSLPTPISKNQDNYVPDGWTDDQNGVSSNFPYEFISKRVRYNNTWGVFSTPSIWSKFSYDGLDGSDGIDGIDGMDGKGIEFVFKRMQTNTVPPTPVASNPTIDDYIPEGWTDNQIGVNSTNIYEYVSKRVKNANNWGVFSTPAVWAKYSFDGSDGIDGSDGLDGIDGVDGKGIEFIFKLQNNQTTPATPVGNQNIDGDIPSGWTNNQTGVNGNLQFEYVSRRIKTNGKWSVFSVPALWAKFSFNGVDGEDGVPGIDGIDGKDGTDTEYIFTRTTVYTTPATPASNQSDDYVPSGWTDDPIGVTSSFKFEWVSTRKKKNNLWSSFSNPALWSNFALDGLPGLPGEEGPAGPVGPYLLFRGDYSANTTYAGSSKKVEVVKYTADGNVTYFMTKQNAGEFSGILPTNATKWERFGASYENIATGLLFAQTAFIDNLWVRNLKTSDLGKRIEITQSSNSLKFYIDNDSPCMQIDGSGEAVISMNTVSNIQVGETFKLMNLTANGMTIYETPISGVQKVGAKFELNQSRNELQIVGMLPSSTTNSKYWYVDSNGFVKIK